MAPYPLETFTVSGPAVPLPPKAVVSLSLALHELATNAAKYGALSAPEGHITVSWDYDRANSHLRMQWKEEGGPEVVTPSRKGFGSTLVERLLTAELKGYAHIAYEKDGVVCVVEADLSQIQSG
jgi:two-component sensor histidine kinase